MKCIWCQHSGQLKSIEHIVPEAVGCPAGFVLKSGEVCRGCNNHLGALDSAVADDLDIQRFMYGIPGKRGKLPTISSRGNVVGSHNVSGAPEISINMESYPVPSHDGRQMGAFGRSPRNIPTSMTIDGNSATVHGKFEFGQNPKFIRGITKIAISSIAYFYGAEAAISANLKPARQFVLSGQGRRSIFVLGDLPPQTYVRKPLPDADGNFVCELCLLGVGFLVDLSPALTRTAWIEQMLIGQYGRAGWTTIPQRWPHR